MQEAVGEQVSGEGNPGWNSRRLSRLHVKQSTSLAGKKGAGSLVIYSMEVHLNSLGWNWKLLLNTDCVHFFSRPSLWPIYLWNHVWHISREERFKLERWSLYGFQGYTQASLEVQTVKNLPAMGETWVWSLGWGTFPGEGQGNRSSILAWRISMDRGAWWATVHGVTKSWAQLSNSAQHTITHTSVCMVIVPLKTGSLYKWLNSLSPILSLWLIALISNASVGFKQGNME